MCRNKCFILLQSEFVFNRVVNVFAVGFAHFFKEVVEDKEVAFDIFVDEFHIIS